MTVTKPRSRTVMYVAVLLFATISGVMAVTIFTQDDNSNHYTELTEQQEQEMEAKLVVIDEKQSKAYAEFGIVYVRPTLSIEQKLSLEKELWHLKEKYGPAYDDAVNSKDPDKLGQINDKILAEENAIYKSFGFIDEYYKLSNKDQLLLDKIIRPLYDEQDKVYEYYYNPQ